MMTPDQFDAENNKPDIIDDDSEVDASRAPLLSHLNELRSRLIKVIIGMICAFGIALFFSEEIFQILARPYVVATEGKEGASVTFSCWIGTSVKVPKL